MTQTISICRNRLMYYVATTTGSHCLWRKGTAITVFCHLKNRTSKSTTMTVTRQQSNSKKYIKDSPVGLVMIIDCIMWNHLAIIGFMNASADSHTVMLHERCSPCSTSRMLVDVWWALTDTKKLILEILASLSWPLKQPTHPEQPAQAAFSSLTKKER